MFDHVQLKVADVTASRPFYEAVLGALGYGVVLELDDTVGLGVSPDNMLEISQARDPAALSRSIHLAFTARDEPAVRAFHAVALAHGATDNGAPGLRPQYEDGYYAAFVIDPNGHNMEAVYHRR